MSSEFAINVQDIMAAADRIAGDVLRTPVVTAPLLNEAVGSELFFKCENLQHVGAFKARGACNAVQSLSGIQAAAGVVTHSSGNHAAALGRAARLRGIPAHIVMPSNSSCVKIQAVRRLGIEPTFCEPTADARQAMADRVIAETGATFIHPYNNPAVMAGQGTATQELLQQTQELDSLVVPVGGGGLLSGSLIAAKALHPDIKVYAAEPAWADDAYRSLQSQSIQMPSRYDTVADGLRTPLGDLTFPIIQRLVDGVLLVSEQEILSATFDLITLGKLLVEPSGAVSLAAVKNRPDLFRGRRVGVMISGGNVDTTLLNQLLSTHP